MSEWAAVLHLAIDLGATSGRAMVAGVGDGGLQTKEVHRFHYAPRMSAGHLRWDFAALRAGLLESIRSGWLTARTLGRELVSVGVDSWGVDYGLLDAEGRLLEDPVCYRDGRTAGVMDRVLAAVPRHDIFARTGIQFLPINTLYQLAAHARDGLPDGASRLLMIADLCHHALCGSTVGERTNASTTQLVELADGSWSRPLLEAIGVPASLMPPLVAEGTLLGELSPVHQTDLGAGPLQVIAPATHDTASAIAATPLADGWAYISSGTWSLVGVELERALVNANVARENFTNEAGVQGTTRFLKNVMGLWIHQACCREWERSGVAYRQDDVLARISTTPEVTGIIYPDDLRFLNPASMLREIAAAMSESGQTAVAADDPVRVTKTILDSLALRYASVVGTIERLTGRAITGIHIVGGGSSNEYLNQATANAAGRPVAAGPAEATALGNVIVQAIACREIRSLKEARQLLSETLRIRRYEPHATAAWAEAATRYRDLEGAAVA